MAELRVEKPSLLKFPMEKLCYDLVLEVIDELDPKDVPELMKVDRRFRWTLLQKPARILGKQIHLINVEMDDRGSLDDERKRYRDLVFIRKFAESRPLPFYFVSHKVLLLSQVERCSALIISESAGWGNWLARRLSALKKAFANLKQVDELEIDICGINFYDVLWNLKAEVTDRASLRFLHLRREIHQQLMLSLINGSLQTCKIISVDLYGDPDFYPRVYEALSKTQCELFITEAPFGNAKSTIEWILNSGIPSENKEAACVVRLSRGEMSGEVSNLIKNFPGIRQIEEPNIRTFIRDTMMEMQRKHGSKDPCSDSDDSRFVSDDPRSDSDDPRSVSVSVSEDSLPVYGESHSVSDDTLSRSDSDDSLHSMDPSLIGTRVELDLDGPFDCYLKRIDEKRDCIYVVGPYFFFAKYVSSIQF